MSNLLNAPSEDIGYLLWRIMKLWQRGRYRLIDEFELTVPQMEMLGAIFHMSKNDGELTQIALSQETGIDPMTTSTILRNLQKKGYISRTESKTDTRARVVSLEPEGREQFMKALFKVETIQEDLFKRIDKKALVTQLQMLLQSLEEYKK